jgi:hypothetical protein
MRQQAGMAGFPHKQGRHRGTALPAQGNQLQSMLFQVMQGCLTDLGPCFPSHDCLPLLCLTGALGHCSAGALAWLPSGNLQGRMHRRQYIRSASG